MVPQRIEFPRCTKVELVPIRLRLSQIFCELVDVRHIICSLNDSVTLHCICSPPGYAPSQEGLHVDGASGAVLQLVYGQNGGHGLPLSRPSPSCLVLAWFTAFWHFGGGSTPLSKTVSCEKSDEILLSQLLLLESVASPAVDTEESLEQSSTEGSAMAGSKSFRSG